MGEVEAKEKRVTRHELRHDRHTVLLLTDQISTEKTNFKETAFPGEKSVSAVEGKIDICVKDMPLVDLAIFIDNIQPIEIVDSPEKYLKEGVLHTEKAIKLYGVVE